MHIVGSSRVSYLLSCLVVLATGCSQQRVTVEKPAREAWRFTVLEGVPLPTARGGHAAGMVRGHAVIVGGNNWTADRSRKEWLKECLVYHEGRWMAGPELPHPLAYGMYAHDARGLYVAGGTDGTTTFSTVYHLSDVEPGTNWKRLAPMPEALQYGAAAIAGDRLYVACGERDEVMSNRVYSLALGGSDGAWRVEPPLPGPARSFPAFVAAGRYIYLLGGVASWTPQIVLNDAYRFDCERKKWERLPTLPCSGYAWNAVLVKDQQLLIAGRADGRINPEIDLLDLETFKRRKIGDAVIQTTTAPLIQVGSQEWWLIGGEPDSNKTRTERVTIIRTARS